MAVDRLPTARLAMSYAVDAAALHEPADAMAWVAIAAELRAGVTAPEAPGDRLALHDIDGIVCAHGRVALRVKGGPGEWWQHSDDGTNCDVAEVSTEHLRRLPRKLDGFSASEPPTTRMDLRGEATTMLQDRLVVPLRVASTEAVRGSASCTHCGYDIYRAADIVPTWRHSASDQVTCPTPQRDANGDEAYTMAWPAPQE